MSDTETCYVLLIQPVLLEHTRVFIAVGTVGPSSRSLRSIKVAERYSVLDTLLEPKLTCRRHISLVATSG